MTGHRLRVRYFHASFGTVAAWRTALVSKHAMRFRNEGYYGQKGWKEEEKRTQEEGGGDRRV